MLKNNFQYCIGCDSKQIESFISQGPYQAFVNANSPDFQHYKTGKLSTTCGNDPNNAVIVLFISVDFVKSETAGVQHGVMKGT